MEMTKGLAEVSRIDSPAASAKSASRKTLYSMILLAG
jgi:hypothetical protein